MRTPIIFFVSYARADHTLVDTFLPLLREQMAPSKRYAYTLWRDLDVLLGEPWHAEIQHALATCQVGLLLLSPAFLTSEYIAQHELPLLLGTGGKPILPVMLQTVDAQRQDLRGVALYQIFRLDNAKAFGACAGQQRRRFVEQLFGRIEQRLDRLYGQP